MRMQISAGQEPVQESGSEDKDDNIQPEKNQCHICRKQLHSEDDFMDHVRDEHFQGMLEAVAGLNF